MNDASNGSGVTGRHQGFGSHDETIQVTATDGILILRPGAGAGGFERSLAENLSRLAASGCAALVICFPQRTLDEPEADPTSLLEAVLACQVPVIAALPDGAGAATWLLALACDEVVYAEEAGYEIDHVARGRMPGGGATYLFPARLGAYLGQEALLTATRYGGRELAERGGASHVVPGPDVSAAALAEARGIGAAVQGEGREERLAERRVVLARVRDAQRTERDVPVGTPDGPPVATPDSAVLGGSRAVQLELVDGGVALVTLCDREHRNTFSEALVAGLTDAFARIRKDPAVRVVVLTGYDSYFACGGTKEALLAIQRGAARFTDQAITDLPLACEVPVVAAMQGHGIGAGWALGMFCDVIFMSSESNYVSPYMRYGFTPGAGSTLVFPQRFGGLAGEILYAATEYKGHELKARRIGMQVLPRADVRQEALRLARRMTAAPREILVHLKALLCEPVRAAIGATFEQEVAMHEQTFVGSTEVLSRIESEFAGDARPSTPSNRAVAGTEVEAVSQALAKLLAEELGVDFAEIDKDKLFVDLGLDSITGVTWIRRVNQRYGVAIPATKVYDHPTIARFAAYLAAEQAEQPPAPAAQAPAVKEAPADDGPLPPVRAPAAAVSAAASPSSPAIAVIGMAGRFPMAGDVDEFWANIASGRDCISEVPEARWSIDRHYDPDPRAPGKTYSKWMGALQHVDAFDAAFFNISPLEAKWTDPQQRLFLEACWHCIENAGYRPSQLSGSACGVFVGCAAGDYGAGVSIDGLTGQAIVGNSCSILASRISYFLDLRGPSLAIDTACSSSLVAVAAACDALTLGNADLALAGGVNVLTTPAMHVMTSKAGMLSPTGRCHTFDQQADGFVPGEGVGVVLLKRLADALRDGDSIHGVLRGWGVNQDGKTNGITAPSAEAQRRLETDVYRRFEVDVSGIQLVEAHGTGTKLGDPIEVEALTASFRSFTDRTHYCALGSVKSNVGHLLTAAGIAGLIKVLQALRHRKLPPTIQYQKLNEHVRLEDGPFYVNTMCSDWVKAAGQPRRAAVSSFGFSGTNAHLVVEELDPGDAAADSAAQTPRLFLLSARNEERLRAAAAGLWAFVTRHEAFAAQRFADLAYTLQVGREPMEERLALVASSVGELRGMLRGYLDGEARSDVRRGRTGERKYLDPFIADDDVAGWLDQWVRKGKLAQLANVWVHGVDVDWRKLSDGTRRRVPLPGYPFARTSYWLPVAAPEQAAAARAVANAEPAPSTAGTLAKPTNILLRDCAELEPAPRAGDIAELPGVAFVAAWASLEELADRVAAASRRADTKVIVVDLSTGEPWRSPLAACLAGAGLLASLEIPVLGMLRKRVDTGPLLLAAGCDLLFVADDIELGGGSMIGDLGDLLTARFGAAAARSLLATPEGLRREEARSCGIRVFPSAALAREARAMSADLAQLPRISLSELSRELKSEAARALRVWTSSAQPPGQAREPDGASRARVRVIPEGVELVIGADGVAVVGALDEASPAGALRGLAAAINEAQHSGATALVVSDERGAFFQATSLEGAAEHGGLWSMLARCPLLTVACAPAGARDGGWALALACDATVYGAESEYRYDRPGRIVPDRLQALFCGRLGRYLGREVLLTGERYTGAELQARSPAVVAPRESATSMALGLARSWSKLPSEEIRRRKAGLAAFLARSAEERTDEPQGDGSGVVDWPSPSGPVRLRRVPIQSDAVTVETSEDGVVVVTMCDRESKNTFTEALVRGLTSAFDHVAASQARAVVLTGYDQYFSSGGSKEALTAIQRGSLKYSDVPIYDMALKCPVPVIAAVQGHALGAGWTFALFSDVVLLSEESVYCSSFMQYGFTPGAGSTLVFPRQLGVELGREALMTAARYRGHDLAARGVGMRVLPRSQVREAALRIAVRLASWPPATLREVKARFGSDLRAEVERTYARELAMQEKTFVGNPEVLRRIEQRYDSGSLEQPGPGEAPDPGRGRPAPDRASEATGEPARQRQAEHRIGDFLRESFARELHMDAADVRPTSRFTDMGLDSITGVTWIQAVNRQYGVIITIKQLHEYPTIAELAAFLASRVPGEVLADPAVAGESPGRPAGRSRPVMKAPHPELVPLNERKQGLPIFWIHAGLGGVDGYEALARRLDRPFFGIQARGWTGDDDPLRGMGPMAGHYLEVVRSVQPEGPYEVGGYSIGGMLAYELARRLQAAGARVTSLAMIDTLDTVGLRGVDLSPPSELLEAVNILVGAALGHDRRKLIHRSELPAELAESELLERLIAVARERGLPKSAEALRAMVTRMVRIQRSYDIAGFTILPLERPHEVDCLYFRNQSGVFLGELGGYYSFAGERLPVDGTCYWSEWKSHLTRLRMVEVPSSSHMTMLIEPAASEVIVTHCERLYNNRRSTSAGDPTVTLTSARAG